MNPSLNLADLIALSHLLVLIFGALVLLLLESFLPQKAQKYGAAITLATLFLSMCGTAMSPVSQNSVLMPWLRFDSLAQFFALFFLVTGIGIVLLADAFFQRLKVSQGEFYFLLIAAIFGLILIGDSADFLILFLGLETLSISLYVLCGYMKNWRAAHEAALKYFLMGALATAFLLYGIALIYGAVGTTQFSTLLSAYQHISSPSHHALFLSGIALVTLGLAFKAAIVPFHVWAPDVYEGASTPVTGFLAVGSKAGAFAALSVIFFYALPSFDERWSQAVAFLAYPTLVYANLVALRQTQLKRFFAYSGISHAGFMLIPLAAGTPDALSSLIFYLIVYAFATLGCFAVLACLNDSKEGPSIQNLRGLFRNHPYLAGIFAFCLLTLAGIPPTAGFLAKLYIFKVAYEARLYGLLVVGLLMTIVSAYYYLRIAGTMFIEFPTEEKKLPKAALFLGAFSLAVILALIFYPLKVAMLG